VLTRWRKRHALTRRSDWALLWNVACLLFCTLPRPAYAQLSAVLISADSLPDAPARSPLGLVADSLSAVESASSITGTVLDANGGLLPGASVVLTSGDKAAERTSISDRKGGFSFGELPTGNFKVAITAPGMEPLVLADIHLGAGQKRELPHIVMAVAGTTTEVRVVVTSTQLAQEQVKAAEHQRVLGILPNFYSSYIWEAAPLNSRQKLDLAFHSITDPVEFMGTAIVAGAEQATDTFPGYGQGAEGYAKRYGAAYADEVLGRLIGSAVLPSLLHQDPRYFYKGSGSVRSRFFYAVSRAVVTRGDDGQAQPNYSRLFGSFAAGGLANLYYPRADRGLGLTLGDGFVSIAGHAADNVIREFLLRRLTPNVPGYARGKQ
jgi:hypothetical protein